MTRTCMEQCDARERQALIPIVAAIAICVSAIASTSAAQTGPAAGGGSPAQAQPSGSTSAPQTNASASSSSKPASKGNATKVRFNPSPKAMNFIQDLKAGTPYAINLCNGDVPSPLPAGFSDADGLKMDNDLTPCKSNTVTGGDGPYRFQLDSGSFPPLGMHLGMNGLLYGTPAPPTLGGYQPFSVCAVDLGGNSNCHQVGKPLPQQAKQGSSHTGLIVGSVLAGGAVVGAVAAADSLSHTSTASSSGTSGSNCTSAYNNCTNLTTECLQDHNTTACQQMDSACTQMCQCEGYSSFNGNTGSCQ
jgi:hypothetical protein